MRVLGARVEAGDPVPVIRIAGHAFSTSCAPLQDPETTAPVRFLPKWGNLLLAFADRTRVLPEQYRQTVIRMNGDVARPSSPTVRRGQLVVQNARVQLEPFAPLSRSIRHELEAEAEGLEAFLAE